MKKAFAALLLAAASSGALAADIVDTAVSAGQFKTLVEAIKAAGLVDTLKGKGPFTVFAPTDEAFAKLPPGTLDGLLKDLDMARVTIDTRPIRSLQGDAILAGSAYQSLLEARENKPDVPVVPKRTTDFVFVRYIGHPDMEVNRPFLDEWARYFAEQIQGGADVYACCHSPDNLIAPYLCRELHRLTAEKVHIPSLPWDSVMPEIPQQPNLF